MSHHVRCESCPAERSSGESLALAAGWVSLEHFRPHPDPPADCPDRLTGEGHDFCSWRCLAEFATARVMIDSVEEGP